MRINRNDDRGQVSDGIVMAGIVAFIVFVIALIIVGFMWGMPKYRLYSAETMKREKIAEAKANSDAAQYEADRQVEIATSTAEADVIRAQGIADANAIISASLTPEYNQWHAIEQMNPKATIVYVPSDGALPLTEAGRTP